MENNNQLNNIYKSNCQEYARINQKIQIALIVFLITKLFVYSKISFAHSTKYFLVICAAVITSVLTEVVFLKLIRKNSFSKAFEIIKKTYPQVIGLIIAATLNYGCEIMPVVVCTVTAVSIARLLYGGYSNNIFSAPAFAIVLLHSAFVKMASTPSMDSNLDKALLKLFNAENVHHVVQISNLSKALSLDQLPYVTYSDVFYTLFTFVFFIAVFIYIKLDFSMSLYILLFLTVICYSFIGFLNGTEHLSSNILQFNGFLKYIVNISGSLGHMFKTLLMLFYLLVGPTVLGIVLVSTYTVTFTNNKIGKYISAFIIAFFVFYTKLFTDNPYGFFYAMLLCNAFTPMFDEICKFTEFNRIITIISLVILSLVIGFIAFAITMKGV